MLSDPVPEIIEAWAIREHPYETCGLLLGRSEPEGIEVVWSTQAANLDRDRPRDRYTLDPQGYVTADRQARQFGLEIVGIWHTHPDHPARPSETDLRSAWKGYAYLIVSTTASGISEMRSWLLSDRSFREQEVLREVLSS